MVDVFDSEYTSSSSTLKMQIACLVFTYNPNIVLSYRKVQEQSGGADCGLFSIAFATALMLGEQPEAFFFNQQSMRKHLKKCFEKQTMQIFPRRRAKQETDLIKCTELIPVYCICRMPDLTDSTWSGNTQIHM